MALVDAVLVLDEDEGECVPEARVVSPPLSLSRSSFPSPVSLSPSSRPRCSSEELADHLQWNAAIRSRDWPVMVRMLLANTNTSELQYEHFIIHDRGFESIILPPFGEFTNLMYACKGHVPSICLARVVSYFYAFWEGRRCLLKDVFYVFKQKECDFSKVDILSIMMENGASPADLETAKRYGVVLHKDTPRFKNLTWRQQRLLVSLYEKHSYSCNIC